MTIAYYPGSFNPIHLGHIAVVTQALSVFEEVVVGVNPPGKASASHEALTKLARDSLAHLPGVSVVRAVDLTVSEAHKVGADCIIKGARNGSDFDDEQVQAAINRQLDSDLVTLLLPVSDPFRLISSTYVRQVASLGGDLSGLVPEPVQEYYSSKETP